MQTSYSQDPVAGLAGQIADGRPCDIETRFAEGAVGVGRFVIVGTAAGRARHPAATWAANPERVLGFAVLDSSRVLPDYADLEQFSVLRSGPIWVAFEPDTTPTVDTPVFARITANGAGKLLLGAVRANGDTGTAIAVPNCYFRKIVGGLAKIELG